VQLIFLIGPGPARRIPGSESPRDWQSLVVPATGAGTTRAARTDLILRSGHLAASRRMGCGRERGLMVRDARTALLTMRVEGVADSARRANQGKLSSPSIKNISLYQNSDLRYQSPRPAPTERRFAIVTIRWAQDAMAAAISGATAWFPKGIKARHRTKERRGRRSRVVLAPRPWRYVGGNLPPATGARKAASPERARISRKPIARGKPGCLGCTCG
jgi:hypothetical protein